MFSVPDVDVVAASVAVAAIPTLIWLLVVDAGAPVVVVDSIV